MTVAGQVSVSLATDVDKDVKHIALILKSKGLCIVYIAGRLIFCEIHISAIHLGHADKVHGGIVVFIPAGILDLHMTQAVFGSKAGRCGVRQGRCRSVLHPVGAAGIIVVVAIRGIPMVVGKPKFICIISIFPGNEVVMPLPIRGKSCCRLNPFVLVGYRSCVYFLQKGQKKTAKQQQGNDSAT